MRSAGFEKLRFQIKDLAKALYFVFILFILKPVVD